MQKKIRATDIEPGDLIYSPRTTQLMCVISALHKNNRVYITWSPLGISRRESDGHFCGSTLMYTDVDPHLPYIRHNEKKTSA
jgi:hypothetical protein